MRYTSRIRAFYVCVCVYVLLMNSVSDQPSIWTIYIFGNVLSNNLSFGFFLHFYHQVAEREKHFTEIKLYSFIFLYFGYAMDDVDAA